MDIEKSLIAVSRKRMCIMGPQGFAIQLEIGYYQWIQTKNSKMKTEGREGKSTNIRYLSPKIHKY